MQGEKRRNLEDTSPNDAQTLSRYFLINGTRKRQRSLVSRKAYVLGAQIYEQSWDRYVHQPESFRRFGARPEKLKNTHGFHPTFIHN